MRATLLRILDGPGKPRTNAVSQRCSDRPGRSVSRHTLGRGSGAAPLRRGADGKLGHVARKRVPRDDSLGLAKQGERRQRACVGRSTIMEEEANVQVIRVCRKSTAGISSRKQLDSESRGVINHTKEIRTNLSQISEAEKRHKSPVSAELNTKFVTEI